VAVSLAQFGLESHFVTRLPAHPVGDAVVRALRAEGVHTGQIARGGSRVGIYFTEAGASQRASTVIYDRAHSAISEIPDDAVNWDLVMAGAAWFHVTGITPALGERAAAATQASILAARRAGARISVDLNFRKKLWTEAQAQAVMRPLMADVDVVIANEEDLQSVLGIHVKGADVTSGTLNVDAYRDAAAAVTETLGPALVAITLRESLSASDNGWSALLFDSEAGVCHRSQRYSVRVVDRIGAGDSFAAGLIYGLLQQWTGETALAFAVGASALKHTIPGDFNRVSVTEVQQLVAGDGSGRVQR
jgi:2-dehydro-3-deoxygluconokinase